LPCPRLFRCAARALNNRSVILRTRLKYPAHPAFAGRLELPFSTGNGTKDRAMPLNTGSFNFANSTPGMPNELQPSTICTSGAASVAHWLGVGTAHAHAGNITDASAAFDEALRLAPGSIEACETACAQLGYCYYGLREFEKSIEMLERAAQCNPGNRHVWLYRAAALHELHRYEEAIPAYEKLLADDPNDYHAKWALAQLYRVTDDFSKGWAAMYRYLPRRRLRKPEWKGEDLSDKTLLVYHQHGFGDLIMYMRTSL
jgi:tetratricopeptide (TPR) repeat protein